MFSLRRMPPENCLDRLLRSIGEPGSLERPVDPLRQLGAGEPLQPPEHIEILARRHQRIHRELLRHDAKGRRGPSWLDQLIEDANLPAVEPHAPGDRADQGRFARAIGTEQRQQLSLSKNETGTVQRTNRSIGLACVRIPSRCSLANLTSAACPARF